jgi:hypothetical protein
MGSNLGQGAAGVFSLKKLSFGFWLQNKLS